MPDTQLLKELPRTLRLDVLDVTAKWGGHVSSCFSAVEILTAIYFGGILRYRPAEPDWSQRDRFILSKGHAAPLFYAVLRVPVTRRWQSCRSSGNCPAACTAIPSPARSLA